MKLIYTLILIFSITAFQPLVGQNKPTPQSANTPLPANIDKNNIQPNRESKAIPQAETSIFNDVPTNFNQPAVYHRSTATSKALNITRDKSGLPIMIKGNLDASNYIANSNLTAKCYTYLENVKSVIGIQNPINEFQVIKTNTDETAITHLRMQQTFQGIKVHNGEVILHAKDNDVFMFNGRYFPTPSLENIEPNLDAQEAGELAKTDIGFFNILSEQELLLIADEQLTTELVIYHFDDDFKNEKLVWHVTAIPTVTSRWEYFIDAQNGTIIHKYSNLCQIHGGRCGHNIHKENNKSNINLPDTNNEISFGPETANALDLNNITRTINVYETGGTYYMIDASRSMFSNSFSNFPNDPVGVIWTIDAFNTSPQNSNFSYDHITSSNNSWSSKTSVSAHYNGGEAYEYFKETFNRNSINGQGGNIVSMINVSDANGSSMDNAFWNGAAMFYGNGNQAFNSPLAKALDVAGHEMSHGVIQATANLEYQKEPGAMNESFADIFGAMIDRDDWTVGEEIVNTSFFPSGAMRDLSNPHNGGSSLNQPYWQPDHMDEFQNLPNTPQGDNGGVHINSGIPNHAYYLFATNSNVGKDKAEQVYYKALKDYLTASSKFVDLRNAVVQAATDIHGSGSAEVQAADQAFDQVGIAVGSGGNYEQDIDENPGDEFVLWSNNNLNSIIISNPDGSNPQAVSNNNHLSKPSITDDGTIISYVANDNTLKDININWTTGNISESILESQPMWRNVANSKDGNKFAAITTENNNEVYVYDFISGSGQWFTLYNPTYTQGVSTGDVLFADVLEWDLSGQYVIYDASNEIDGANGSINYWDIGFLHVWDDGANDFADGNITKLFQGLPENISIGNPSFSKNSPYIIAFDAIENDANGTTNYSVKGINIESNDQGTIYEGNTLGYPSYSIDDDQMLFSFLQQGTQEIIAVIDLANDKINGSGEPLILIEDAYWGTYFATGERDLDVPTKEIQIPEDQVSIYPNPFESKLTLELNLENANDKKATITVFDLYGKELLRKTLDISLGKNTIELSLEELPTASYYLKVSTDNNFLVKKVVKLQGDQ